MKISILGLTLGLLLPQSTLPTSIHLDKKLFTFTQKPDLTARLVPVRIFTEDQFAGSGTLLLDERGAPDRILSAAHVFSDHDGRRIYEYRAEGSEHRGFISAIDVKPYESAVDIAVCTLGVPVPLGQSVFPARPQFHTRAVGSRNEVPIKVIELATGRPALVVGTVRDQSGTEYYIITREDPVPGESGSGFYDPAGNIFVLQLFFRMTKEAKEGFGIETNAQSLAVATPVSVR